MFTSTASSAKRKILPLVRRLPIELTNKRNSNGPRQEPCTTPVEIRLGLLKADPTLTTCEKSFNRGWVHRQRMWLFRTLRVELKRLKALGGLRAVTGVDVRWCWSWCAGNQLSLSGILENAGRIWRSSLCSADDHIAITRHPNVVTVDAELQKVRRVNILMLFRRTNSPEVEPWLLSEKTSSRVQMGRLCWARVIVMTNAMKIIRRWKRWERLLWRN